MKFKNIKIKLLVLIVSSFFCSCTDIEPESTSTITPDNFFQNEDDFKASVSSVYEGMWGLTAFNYLYTVEANSDAICTPSRVAPAGWEDGGTHRKLEYHSIEPSQGWPVADTYNNLLSAIARANVSVTGISISKANIDPIIKGRYLDEARTLRAFFYWLAMDLYGDVPLVKTFQDSKNPVGNTPRKEIFKFLVDELVDVINSGNLYPSTMVDGKSVFPRITVMTAKALLAKIYLNGEIYTGEKYYKESLALCNDLINNKNKYGIGLYNGDFMELFGTNNKDPKYATEILFFFHIEPSKMANYANIGWTRFSLPLGMKTKFDLNYDPWNGACLEKHFVDTFDPDDIRYKKQILDGPQFEKDGVTPILTTTAPRVPLVMVRDFPLIGASENQGCRITKWQGDKAAINGNSNNGWPIIRYADILLVAAECELRTSGSQLNADNYVNEVRARAFSPAKPLSNVSLLDVYNERGRELFSEGHRRIDQIRFDKWGDGDFKNDANFKSANYTKIWPFPNNQLEANKNLKQNPGY